MKKILSIVVILFLTTVTTWGATTLTLEATASPTNGGTLKATGGSVGLNWRLQYVWNTKDYSSNNGKLTATGKNDQDGIAGRLGSDMAVKIENITATANKGFYFSKWEETTANGDVKSTPESPTPNPITNPFSITWPKASGNKSVYYRATFLPLVAVPSNGVKMVAYEDAIEDVNVQLSSVHNRSSLAISLEGTYSTYFQLAKQGETTFASSLSYTSEIGADKDVSLTFQIRYIGDGTYSQEEALNATNTSIKVVDNEGNAWTIPVVVTEPETYTFLGVPNGKYSVDFIASERDAIENISEGDTESVELRGDDYSIKLTAVPDTGYELFGWQMITTDDQGNDNTPEYFNYDSDADNIANDINIGRTAKIYPIFIPKTQATFYIKEDIQKTPYLNLQDALDVASATSDYSIVVFSKKEGVLAPRKNANNEIIAYDIPTGVTLLIPGDDAFTCSKAQLTKSDVALDGTSATPKCQSKLIVESNTQFNVKGSIYLYAKIRHDNVAGQPVTYSHMHLKDNVTIELQSGSSLYAYGYITGDFEVNGLEYNSEAPQIIAKDGSNVYELFQFTDWRGGNASNDMKGNSQKVFPIKQYYIQNIEVPLTIKQGATEHFLTAVEASSEISVASSKLIAPGSNGALFCAVNNTDVVKFYDVNQDRLKLIIRGMADGAEAMFGSITLQFKMIISVTLTSSDYVLPINNNMDLLVDNVSFKSTCDIELLPGSTLTINENASVIIQANKRVFLYDADENVMVVDNTTSGYCGQYNSKIIPITYTPSKASINSIRTSVEDAKVVFESISI